LEQKNRLLIAIAVICLLAGAMFTSFGRTLLALNTPSVVLPGGTDAIDGPASSGMQSAAGQYQRVEVTPATVQAVIATLDRLDSYSRELTVETFWEGGSSTLAVQMWTDGGWTSICQTLPSGVTRYDLVGDGTVYYWYSGSQQYKTAPADELSPDLAQRIPTYETVLALDPDTITAADYQLLDDQSCIYVEVQQDHTALLERYWVSVDSGLLVAAEAEQAGETVYRLTADTHLTVPCPASAPFTLPNGTVVHTISGAASATPSP
jgi:hypothetical protein